MSLLQAVRQPVQNAERWLKQAGHDLRVARTHYDGKFFSDCCFMSWQAAQKAINAFLIACGEQALIDYSVRALVKQACGWDAAFQPLLEAASILDQYFLPTRYPQFLAEPAVPCDSYTEKEAREAVAFAQQILDLVSRHVQ